ncbi:hypothetical protein VPH35_055774 [Triticum aestivum]
MAKHTTFLLVAIVAILLTATAATLAKAPAPTANKPTAYEMLGRYGFPPGILPEGVHDYELRPDGSFEVNFVTRVAGNIKNDTISSLEGIKVKVFIAWASIKEVGRDGDELRLHAGIISKSFPVGDFSSSPKCN